MKFNCCPIANVSTVIVCLSFFWINAVTCIFLGLFAFCSTGGRLSSNIHLSTKLNGHVRLFWFLLYQYNYLYFLALSRSTDASLFYVFNFLLDLDRIIESGFNEMIEKSQKILWSLKGAPRAKHDCVNGHISKRKNVNWMEKIALFRDKSICHPAWLGKLGVNMHFRQFLGVICAKNLCESGILRGPLKIIVVVELRGKIKNCETNFEHF